MAVRSPNPRAVLLAASMALVAVYCRDAQLPTDVTRAGMREATPPKAPEFALSPTAPVLIGAGDIASCTVGTDESTAQLLDAVPDATVFTVGDNAYVNGTLAEYTDCYGPTWGRHKARTRPAVGDRDYNTANADGYRRYFGAAGGDSAKYYYSYDVGAWHVVVLNSKVSTSATSAQVKWLKADLQASAKRCTMAYWHKPYYSSASGVRSGLKPVWDVLYGFGVELVVSADNRYYERFAPQSSDGVADPSGGVRQFIVGTGGAGTTSLATPLANSEAMASKVPGVLKLTLDAGAYEWQFVPVAGQTYTDAGAGTCHDAPPPVARPGGPYTGEGSIAFDGRASSDPQGEVPLTYAWDFGDGTSGTGATPVHAYAADGVYTVTLVVTDAKGNPSPPASTTATIANVPPVVNAGADQSTTIGSATTITFSFTDAGGAADAPWGWRVQWGDGSADDVGSALTQSSISLTHTYAVLGGYTARVTVTDKDGGAGSDDVGVTIRAQGVGAVILAAGDISDCSNNRDELTAQILDTIPGTVFTIGDNVYDNGTAAEYANCYHPTWGRHKARTWATLGNHEYGSKDAVPTFDYFGARAGPRLKGFYSVEVGDWHIIVINDELSMSSGSEQDLWLQSDLAANTKKCVMAIWHQPRFMSSDDGFNVRTTRKILWDRLWAAGAEVVLNGHQHFYERLHPMQPDGTRDDVNGIREFIVGTGGESSKEPTLTLHPNSVVRSDHFGVIKMTLYADSYEWKFIPAKGYTFTDSGTGTCH